MLTANASAVIKQDEFKLYGIENGLSNGAIICITQDKDGFIWVGTRDGLNRHDGYVFKRFHTFIRGKKNDTYITALTTDKYNNLWIGTLNGELWVYRANRKYFQQIVLQQNPGFIPVKSMPINLLPVFNAYPSMAVTAIATDKYGRVFVGTWGSGIYYLPDTNNANQKHFFANSDEQKIPGDYISAICADSASNIFFACYGSGLIQLTIPKGQSLAKNIKQEQIFFSIANKQSSLSFVSALSINKSGLMIAGTGTGQIFFKMPEDSVAHPIEGKFIAGALKGTQRMQAPVTAIAQYQSDVSFSLQGGGVWVMEFSGVEGEFLPRTRAMESTLPGDEISCMYYDATGVLWAGSMSGLGLHKQNKDAVFFERIPIAVKNSVLKQNEKINCLTESKNNRLWVGTEKGGLYIFDAKSMRWAKTSVNAFSGFAHASITAICCDSKGNLWAGTDAGLIVLFYEGNPVGVLLKNREGREIDFYKDRITGLVADMHNRIWVGTAQNGLIRLEIESSGYNAKYYKHDELYAGTVPGNRITGLYPGENGEIYISFAGGNICSVSPAGDEFVNINYDTLPAQISTMFMSKGEKLLGTFGEGLLNLKKQKGSLIVNGNRNLFSGENILGVLKDYQNRYWMTSTNGILLYNTLENSVIRFGSSHGLQQLQFSKDAVCMLQSGEMFSGSVNGLYRYVNTIPPLTKAVFPTAITAIRIAGNDVTAEDNGIVINDGESGFSVDFASMDFRDPESYSFKFCLEGFDTGWNYTSTDSRTAVYRNLPPGEYVLLVKSVGYFDNSANAARLLYVSVTAPFWQRWWFMATWILLLLGIVYFIIAAKREHARYLHGLKTKLSADLHDSIGSGLTEIALLSEVVKMDKSVSPGVLSKIQTIRNRASELVDEMSDIVWLVNPPGQSLAEIVIRIKKTMIPVCESLRIKFEVHGDGNLNKRINSIESRQNIFLLMKEAINNAIKHSGAHTVKLGITVRRSIIIVSIKDDGSGLDSNFIGSGNGMKTMKSRAASLGGEIEIKKNVPAGTEISCIFEIK